MSLGVPQVRDAVHKATQPRQYAKPKTRVRPAAATPDEGTQVASAETPCPSVTPFALSNLPTAGETEMPSSPVQVAEAPTPDPTPPIVLSPKIFVPPGGSSGGTTPVPEPETWVQLMLGFGLIGGVARVSYRRNGTDPKAAPDAA